MLQAVTFDFWHTLYQGTFAQEERLRLLDETLTHHGQPRPYKDLEAAYRHTLTIWEHIWREEHRSITSEYWLREALLFLKAELPEDTLPELCRATEDVFLHSDGPQLIPGVAETIPRLARRYSLGLISDTGLTPGRVLREILRRDGLLPLFGALTFSDETGTTKPLPEQFLRTLDALQAQAEQSAHIGDLPETDLAGARAVGMKAVLFLGESRRQDGQTMADATFEKYQELENLLERLE